MTYLIYARKYRPKLFEDMIGQKAVVQTLQNAIKNNRVAQAYLFSGMRGVGKTTAARILAKALNCVHGPTPTPCNVCEMCVEIDEDRSLDVLEIDGASNRGIDDIRSLRDSVRYKAIRARTKIIYIDEVHQVTGPAFNALLKTLEEPPPGTVFIFATTEFHKVPATIVSRCQHFEFKKVSHREIVNHLNGIAGKEHLTITEYGLGLIAEASEGSIRDAQSLLDQAVSFCGESIGDAELGEILGAINRSFLFEFSAAVVEGKSDQIFALTGKVMDAGYDLRHFYKALVLHFRDLLLMRTVEKPEELLVFTPEDMARLKDEAGRASGEEWLRWLQAMQSAEGGLKFASHPQIYFETLLVRLCHFKEIVPIRDLLKEIEELKSSGGGTGEVRRVPVLPGSPPRPEESKPKPSAPTAPAAPRAAAAPAEPPPAERAGEAPADSGRAAEEGPAANGLPGRRLSDREMALKDPSVSLFMKKFKAQILAVQPPSGGKDEEE